MRILNAIYLTDDGVKKEIQPRDITPRIYENKLKGKLYCPTENCPARISFSSGKTAHFKTWRFDEHTSACTFYFERIPMNLGWNTTNTLKFRARYRHNSELSGCLALVISTGYYVEKGLLSCN